MGANKLALIDCAIHTMSTVIMRFRLRSGSYEAVRKWDFITQSLTEKLQFTL